jgi:hypothetical protein
VPEDKTYEDQPLTCSDCGGEFTFEAGEQEFFETQGFPPPKRCRTCRAEKKKRWNKVAKDKEAKANA